MYPQIDLQAAMMFFHYRTGVIADVALYWIIWQTSKGVILI